ncbi:Methionine--tRNA ligase [Labeo rohita]|uniref:Methionine--tRNA ligase n=1 Tax=Labeo rohita TaxID=84645 RepID=A0ABQ8MKR6_LABRO|nr:Methionine--tRNA ligase [Labeo rohita]
MRRYYWILRGREAIRRHQLSGVECQRWRAKPNIPKMAELPPARLHLMKPAFYSTGVDCFGPFLIKRGRSNEKRWGIVFKCMTTRCVHLDLLSNMDTDSFLMAVRRMVARRGTPSEILVDQGTNFRGGDKELQTAFTAMSPHLQTLSANQKIQFHYNPPNAPHFGGMWEREIRSVKSALHTIVGSQILTEEVLRTLLAEVEAILNAKPLGYVSSDVAWVVVIADPDPVTPNYLLMGRPDASLPQVVYPESEILSRRRWQHSQVMADQFWTSFIKNYLPALQPRQKWMSDSDNLTPRTVVMIIDHQLPRGLWPVGKVITTYPGSDGRVRSAKIEVRNKLYHRPVARLITLPAIPDDNPTTD